MIAATVITTAATSVTQLSGCKTFTLVDPAPLHGLTVYPARQRVQELVRHGTGRYTTKEVTAGSRTYDNFPLVNVTHPDLERHPLFAHAVVIDVEVPEGAALVLPAYWYHQVSLRARTGCQAAECMRYRVVIHGTGSRGACHSNF